MHYLSQLPFSGFGNPEKQTPKHNIYKACTTCHKGPSRKLAPRNKATRKKKCMRLQAHFEARGCQASRNTEDTDTDNDTDT